MSVELINTGGTTTAALAFAVAVSEGASSDFNIDWSACLPELAGGASCQNLGQRQHADRWFREGRSHCDCKQH